MKIKIPSKRNMLEKEEFNLRVFFDEYNKYYKVCAYNSKKEEVARATFKLSTYPTRHVWLYKISTDELYQHKGYSSAIMYAMEYIAIQNRFDHIEAKYFPENEYAKAFYDKHDYVIFKDGYETYLSKSLDHDFIKQQIESNIQGFQIENMPEKER